MIIPFCPNQACACNKQENQPKKKRWYRKIGFHFTKVVGNVQRYKCKYCAKTFSDRTFNIDYYTKKTIPYNELNHRIISSESLSAMARNIKVSNASISNRLDRFGRNALAIFELGLKDLKLNEDLCADGFESFDRSQYFPCNIDILIGCESQTLYNFTYAYLKRKGRMTNYQKKNCKIIAKKYCTPKGSSLKAFSRLINAISKLWDAEKRPILQLITDEHNLYPIAIAQNSFLNAKKFEGKFIHTTVSSKITRSLFNPLFPVNYYDRELRKDIAAYQRESICYSRSVSNGLLRFSIYAAYHNYVKHFRITNKAIKEEAHAVIAGVEKIKIEELWRESHIKRFFLSKLSLSEEAKKIWCKDFRTPLREKHDYVAKYVFG